MSDLERELVTSIYQYSFILFVTASICEVQHDLCIQLSITNNVLLFPGRKIESIYDAY